MFRFPNVEFTADWKARHDLNVLLLVPGIEGLLSSGYTSGLGRISSLLDKVSSITSDNFAQGAASGVTAEIIFVQEILDETAIKQVESSVVVTPVIQTTVAIPEEQEIQFVSDDSYALTLKGYSGKGLLAAAASGVDFGLQDISVLTISAPRPPHKKEESTGQTDATPTGLRPFDDPIGRFDIL